jgi:hypothetical protein
MILRHQPIFDGASMAQTGLRRLTSEPIAQMVGDVRRQGRAVG